jgi:hypothetical protein
VRTAYCQAVTNEPYRNGRARDLNPLNGEQRIMGMQGNMAGITVRELGCERQKSSNGSAAFTANLIAGW